MAYIETIQTAGGVLQADIAPLHGGMVAQLRLQGRRLLHLEESALETAPMSAGGMPVLFPFPSKTREDRYELDGSPYYMPMHGLLKNAAFAVKSRERNAITLWMEGSPAWRAQCYPFDFHLELTYRVEGASLFTTAAVTNRSRRPMPHCLGWHPFFLTSDKGGMRLDWDFTVQYDYRRQVDLAAPERLDLGSRLDDVFHTPRSGVFQLTAPRDGYAVRCVPDRAFQVLTVCSWVSESMCVEPWCGLPDSINSRRFLQWVAPGATERYAVEWQARLL